MNASSLYTSPSVKPSLVAYAQSLNISPKADDAVDIVIAPEYSLKLVGLGSATLLGLLLSQVTLLLVFPKDNLAPCISLLTFTPVVYGWLPLPLPLPEILLIRITGVAVGPVSNFTASPVTAAHAFPAWSTNVPAVKVTL